MYYILWYAIEWLVSWLRRPPLLWSGLDILAILIEIYSFYVVIAELKRFIKTKIFQRKCKENPKKNKENSKR